MTRIQRILGSGLACVGWSDLVSVPDGSEILLDENGDLIGTGFEARTATTASGAFALLSVPSRRYCLEL